MRLPVIRFRVKRFTNIVVASLGACSVASCDSLATRPSLYGAVTARVERSDSSAIAGSRLILYSGARVMGYGTSGVSGLFTFTSVPEGIYGVRAIPPTGYAGIESLIGGPEAGVADQLVLVGGKTVSVKFNFLKKGNGFLGAHVVDAAGKPLPNIPVSLYSPTGTIQNGFTDATGSFAFDSVSLGNYGVFARKPAAYIDSAENALPQRDGLIIEQGTRRVASFSFALCVGSVKAIVRDSTGASVPGALLTFYGPGRLDDLVLDATSSKLFDALPCGVYGIRVRPPEGWTVTEGRGTSFADQLSVHRGTAIQQTLIVNRIGRAIVRVRVVDDLGTPVGNVRVVLYTGAGLVRDVLTGADGFVTMDSILINNEYGVRAVSLPGYALPEASGSSFFDGIRLVNGETRDFVFRLKRL